VSLEVLWFVLVAVLWGGYFLLEGFDFGVGMLLPFLPSDEEEQDVMFDTIGPVWDGNEVWLVSAGAATFAAFPSWYATMFSGFYLALLLVLVFLILRVVSFEWRTKGRSHGWRRFWLWANAVGSFGIPLIWGIALSNLLRGVPFDSSGNYTGNFWNLFSGYTVLAGIALVLVFAFHGATFLTIRTTGDLCARAALTARRLSIAATLVGAAFLAWTVKIAVDNNDKSVFPPVLPAAIAAAAFVLAVVFVHRRRSGWAFTMTATGVVAIVATLFTSLYPRVMVSSTNFAYSLTISNASSAHYTLVVMSVAAAIVLPLVIVYQGWTYHVFRQRLGRSTEPPIAGAPAAVPSEPTL
jgi:cytochrome bd ubiquinol oxidase subunit II